MLRVIPMGHLKTRFDLLECLHIINLTQNNENQMGVIPTFGFRFSGPWQSALQQFS